MHRLRLALLASVSASAIAFGAALPAAAATIPDPAPIVRAWDAPRQEHPEGGEDADHTKILLWSISGVAAGGVIMGTLYLLKRRVGAFPKNPSWVAPISIMESKTFADEGTFGDAPSEGHHAPAHHGALILGRMAHLGLASDRVVIADYDPCWPHLFEREAARLSLACGFARDSIVHVGSTAVPGLAAKPILDIMVGVESLDSARELVPSLERSNYIYLGPYGIDGRLFFRTVEPCTHHVHIVEQGGPFWRNELLFRDYLRENPIAAGAYVDLKRQLARRFADNRPAYTAAKGQFIEFVLADARGRRLAARE